ncbi:MAG: DNA repair protein RecN [Pseudomonadota bacterium]
MLARLRIDNLLVIKRADLVFTPGFNAFTGETGAGKSVLLEALRLVLGGRAQGEPVRKGADRLDIEACFDPPFSTAIEALAATHEIEYDPSEALIVRRLIESGGRSHAMINARRLPASLLRQFGTLLVEFQEQGRIRQLLEPSWQMALLDQHSSIAPKLASCRQAWQEWHHLDETRTRLLGDASRQHARRVWLDAAISELEAFNPVAGERETMEAERTLLRHAVHVRECCAETRMHLEGSDGASAMVTRAIRRLERVEDALKVHFVEALSALERASVELQEASFRLDDEQFPGPDSDDALERIESRLFTLQNLARTYQSDDHKLAGLYQTFLDERANLERDDQQMAGLDHQIDQAEQAWRKAAEQVSKARRHYASRLEVATMRAMPDLGLETARFAIRFIPHNGTPRASGQETVQFLVATNPEQALRPIEHVASGGELSRLFLLLSQYSAGEGKILVFDEIDTGLGGRAAAAVGRNLRKLGEGRQIFTVTHAPQVAAAAATHFKVEKHLEHHAGKSQASSCITAVHDDGRTAELARMLAGEKPFEGAFAAARDLEQEMHR